jgi:pimeloyl-[acyl-carrier protein] methyl ester esterase
VVACKPTIVLAHGWGYSPRCWQPLLPLLRDHAVHCVDFGYWQDASSIPWPPILPAAVTRQPWIGVGHSLGFMWLLQQDLQQLQAAISLYGFSRFAVAPDWPHGVPPRAFAPMRAYLPHDPVGLLKGFYQMAGDQTDFPAGHPNAHALSQGLDLLEQGDGRAALAGLAARHVPLQAIAAQHDQIVPPALSRASFEGSEIIWQPHARHCLSASPADWQGYAQLIRRFL